MTKTRWLIVIFWVVVVFALLKECVNTHDQIISASKAAGPPRQYFFVQPISQAKPAPGPSVLSPNAEVHQTNFTFQDNSPGQGMFTCRITVRNEGTKTAKNISVHVRPYRDAVYGSTEVGHVGYRRLKDTEILSQYGTWVAFPDLKPNESSTQSAVFMSHPNVTPGSNPYPEIEFKSVP